MQNSEKDKIYSFLFEDILANKYPKGVRLIESQIAKQFGVSRTPIREVLQQLASDGLVELLPNRGARVLAQTSDDIEEIYALRKHLELLALDFSIHKINLDALRALREKIAALYKEEDLKTALQSDIELHNFIVETSERKRLISMLNQLYRISQQFRHIGFSNPDLLKRVTDEHLALIDAIMTRDLGKAKEVLAGHLENSKIATLQFLFKSGAFSREKTIG